MIEDDDRPSDSATQAVAAPSGTVVWIMIEDEDGLNEWFKVPVMFFERRYRPLDSLPYYWAPMCAFGTGGLPALFTEDDLSTFLLKERFGEKKTQYQHFDLATEEAGHPTTWPGMPEYEYVADSSR